MSSVEPLRQPLHPTQESVRLGHNPGQQSLKRLLVRPVDGRFSLEAGARYHPRPRVSAHSLTVFFFTASTAFINLTTLSANKLKAALTAHRPGMLACPAPMAPHPLAPVYQTSHHGLILDVAIF